MTKTILTVLIFLYSLNIYPQELNCNVQIVTQQIQGTNKQVFQTMQEAIYEFMNNTAWTSNVFELEERIECTMLFNLQEQIGDDEFKGTLQIQVRRPVYNSSLNTVLFNYVDNDLHFSYVEYQPLQFSENTHILNLTSILAYYAYIILGLDYDSFSYEGGTEFFQKAEKIVNNAQNASEKGWKSVDSQSRKNRYWLINNILNEDFSPVREFIYRYHRLGLDKMYEKLNEARAEIAESLKLLQQVYRNKPDPFMHFLQVIYDAKSDEFVNIFKESFQDEKTRVFTLLNEIDPANTNKYEAILK
jgi:DNA-binding NtrC family response regulator